MLIDTHTHIVADDHAKYPFDPGYPATWYQEIPVSAEKLWELMGESGVERALLVQGFGPYKYDNSYAADAAQRYPDRFSSVGVVDPEQDPVAKLTYWVKERGLRGVRLIVSADEANESWLDVWEQAIALAVPVLVQIQAPQTPQLVQALQRFRETPIALDHCGFPDLSGGPPYANAKEFFALAEFPSVHLKVTSIVLQQAGQDGGDPRDLMTRLVGAFGAERLMWGSDYSQTNNRTYPEFAELARYASSGLSARDQEWYHRETALKFWPELGPELG